MFAAPPRLSAWVHRQHSSRPMNTVANVTTRAALVLATLLAGGCAWLGLGWGALTYPTTQAGEAANVVVAGPYAYLTRGSGGIEVLHLASARSVRVALPMELDSADDVAVADGLLFVLDARTPGHLAAFSLADPAMPTLQGMPVTVDVGPFSGVAAAGGRVVVSGGTARLELRTYDRAGKLGDALANADLGRGQPDVLLCPYGEYAFVSAHDWGPYFSLKVARLSEAPPGITLDATLELDTYGFTPGGARPANFPLESAIAGETLFLASAQGLSIIGLSSTSAPQLLAQLALPVQPVNVDVLDGVAALVGSAPQPLLVLVDVRDPAHPTVLQSFPLPEGSRATGVALTPSRVVVAAHGRGSLLFDRSRGTWEHVSQPFPLLTSKGVIP